jgi:hypothetical protein
MSDGAAPECPIQQRFLILIWSGVSAPSSLIMQRRVRSIVTDNGAACPLHITLFGRFRNPLWGVSMGLWRTQ